MIYSLPILWRKKNFPMIFPLKRHHYGFLFLKSPPNGDQDGVSLDFDQVWVGEDLCQIWCFIQNLRYTLKTL